MQLKVPEALMRQGRAAWEAAEPWLAFAGRRLAAAARTLVGAEPPSDGEREAHPIYRVAAESEGRWSVSRDGEPGSTRVFGSKRQAVLFARRQARQIGGGVSVHRRDGSLQHSTRYDPAHA